MTRPLLILLALVGALHGLALWSLPSPRLQGDELHYLARAQELAQEGETSLLLGRLAFDDSMTARGSQPLLAAHVIAQFLAAGGEQWAPAGAPGAVFALQLVLLLALLACLWWSCAELGLGLVGRLVACALLGLFPWFAFYVHALWPEVLHALLAQFALACALRYLRSGRAAWLAPAGIALAYATATKSTLAACGAPLTLFLALGAGRRARAQRGGAWRAALGASVLWLSFAAALAPQLLENRAAGHGLAVAQNRWWNLEWGLRMPTPSEAPEGLDYERLVLVGAWSAISADYLQAPTIAAREEASKQRVMDFVAETSAGELVARQLEKLGWLARSSSSMFELALFVDRWGAEPPALVRALRGPARWMWWGLLGLGLVGLCASLRSGAGYGLLSLLVAYLLLVLFLIPVKPRFAMPMIPLLCIFSGLACERAWLRLRR